MMQGQPTIIYWAVVSILFLWALGGASIYVAYIVETPEEFAQAAETAENRQGYAEYVAAIPAWAIAVGIIAAAARMVGAIGFLLQRTWALPAYVISLVFFLVALYRAFVLANVSRVMSPAHIAIEILFLALTVFAIWFAYKCNSTGLLR